MLTITETVLTITLDGWSGNTSFGSLAKDSTLRGQMAIPAFYHTVVQRTLESSVDARRAVKFPGSFGLK